MAKVCWPHNLCSADHHVGLLQTYGPIQMTYCQSPQKDASGSSDPPRLEGLPLLRAVIFHYQEVEKKTQKLSTVGVLV